MDLTEAQRAVTEAMGPLCEPLYGDILRASEAAAQFFDDWDMSDPRYSPGRHHLARCIAHRQLSRRPQLELGGWKVTSRPRPNAPLILAKDAMRLRLLRPLPNDTVPPPGRNKARIAYYSNHRNGLLSSAGSDFLGLWDLDAQGEELNIRIVRPTGDWKYGGVAKIDIDFTLPRMADDFADLEFRPVDDDMDVQLPFVEEEGDDEERG